MNLRDCLVRYGIVDSPRVCRLSVPVQLFFRNLLHAGDGAGRFKVDYDDLRTTFYRHALDRVTRRHITSWLAECHSAGLVRLYTGPDGAGYCELLNYGQRDTKRRVIHPGPQDDALNFERPPAAEPPPRPPPSESEQKGSECESPADEIGLNPRRKAAHTHTPRKTSHLSSLDPKHLDTYLEHLGTQNPGVNIRAEITRATAYVRRIRGSGAKLTLKFFEENWLPKAGGPSLSEHAPIERIPEEPDDWREMVNDEFPSSDYARGGSKEGTAWADLDADIRRHFLAMLPGWLKRTGRSAA